VNNLVAHVITVLGGKGGQDRHDMRKLGSHHDPLWYWQYFAYDAVSSGSHYLGQFMLTVIKHSEASRDASPCESRAWL